MDQTPSIGIDDLLEAAGLRADVDGLGRLAKDLSEIARRQRPWSWRYLHQVRSGKMAAGRKLRDAMGRFALVLDGRSPLIAASVEIAVFGQEELIGAYIMGAAKRCPECGLKFVPSVPWRLRCPKCSPPR